MELDRLKLLKAIDAAAANKDEAAVARLRSILPNPADAPENAIDTKTGAGFSTRVIVGNARTPEDRLANMRLHYPEAQPYGDDGENFIYNSRETGQPMLMNPPGWIPELGDFAEYGRELTSTVTGTLGGIVGSPSTVGALGTASASAVAGGYAYDELVDNAFGGIDSRGTGEKVAEAGIEFATGLIPFERALGPAKDFISPRLRGLMTNANQAVIDVANKYKIRATAGVLGNKFMAGVDAATQKVLGGVDAWERSANEMMEGVAKMIDSFHLSLGGAANPESAGTQLINQAKKYMDNFQTTSQQLYKNVENLIPADARVPALQTRNFLSEYRDRFASDPEFQRILRDSTVGALADAAEEGGQNMGYRTISELRTLVGGKINDRVPIGDLSQRDMKNLYKALTEDLFEGAKDFGDEAFKAATDANDFYRAGSQIIDDVIEPNFMVGGDWATGTEAFGAIKRMVSDPEKLRNIQASGVLEETDFNQVGSALLEDAGRATRGAQNAAGDKLSPSRILAQTDQSLIPAASQDILFTGSAKEILQDMRVFGEAVQGVEGLVNRSNTSNILPLSQAGSAGMALMSEPFTGAATVVTTIGVPYLTSKGMASKWLKDWMLGIPKEGGEQAMKEWKASGLRIATAQGVAPFFEALLEFDDEVNSGSKRGALEE